MWHGHNSLNNINKRSYLIRYKKSNLLFLIISFFALLPFTAQAAITQFSPVDTAPFSTVSAYEIALDVSGCVGSEKLAEAVEGKTHFLFTPTNVRSVSQLIVYFHGNNSYSFDDMCSGGDETNPPEATVLGACHAISDSQQVAILALRRPDGVGSASQNWFSEVLEPDMQCFFREVDNILSQAGITSNPAYTFAGWSGGGGTIRNIIEYLPSSNILIFDGCYGDPERGGWCSSLLRNARSDHRVFFYYDEAHPGSGNSAGTDTTLRGPALCTFRRTQLDIDDGYYRTEANNKNLEACRSREAMEDYPNKATGILVNNGHYEIPAQCITDFLQGTNQTRCGGIGMLDQQDGTVVPNPILPTGSPTVAPVTTDVPQPQQLLVPNLRIKIPGLSFTAATDDFLVENSAGGADIRVSFLGQYIAAVYRFAIAISTTIAAIVILVSGIQWLSSAGGDGIAAAKQRIVTAIIGLILAAGSYLILFTINPDLVRFQYLDVPYIEGRTILGTGDDRYNYTTGGTAQGLTGRNWQNITGSQPEIVDRELLVPDPYNFCFPLSNEGRRYNINRINWGQARDSSKVSSGDLIRCHAGADLIVDGANYDQTNRIGEVYAMTAGIITDIQNTGFTSCKHGKTDTSNPGSSENTGSLTIYDPIRNLTYVYGEMNKDSTNHLSEGQEVTTGQFLGRATKCVMLHLEIYEGPRRDRGTGGHVQRVAIDEGWYLFDEYAPGGADQWVPISGSLPSDQLVDICASNQAYRHILTQTGNKLLDPRAFLISIANNDCTPGSTFIPGQSPTVSP